MDNEELNPDSIVQQNKAKKNLVYFGMFSVIMFFAGLTSAYIVSMGDSFWLKTELPTAFMISTAIIILSSLVYQFSIFSIKKGNRKGLKAGISLTFILGILFVIFQFKGYSELSENGVRINQDFFVDNGYYGYNEEVRLGYFDVKYKGDFITTDGYDYFIDKKKLSVDVHNRLKSFMVQFEDTKFTMWDAMAGDEFEENKFIQPNSKFKAVKIEDFELFYRKELVSINDEGTLMKFDSTKFLLADKLRLRNLANNIRDNRGDFFVGGKMGEDFQVFYTPKVIVMKDGTKKKNTESLELEYVNRKLTYKGIDADLSEWDFHSAMEAADTSSAYLYMITFMHLLHILVTMFYILKLVIRSFTGKITQDNFIALKMGGLFWHFLGALWVYLLLFLLFIH